MVSTAHWHPGGRNRLGSGLFDKLIRRKRNVDGGVLAGRFRVRINFRNAERSDETSADTRFKVHRRSSNRSRDGPRQSDDTQYRHAQTL